MGSFLQGLTQITAEQIGTKVGLSLISDVLTGPVDFFLKQGLEALFGGSEDNFNEILQELDKIETEIKQATLEVSKVVIETDLENLHVDINELFENFKAALEAFKHVETGFNEVYVSLYQKDPIDKLTQIGTATEQIHDILIGGGAINSTNYLEAVTKSLYGDQVDISTFNTRISSIGALFLTDLINSSLICICIYLHTEDDAIKNIAATKIKDIGTYSQSISNHLKEILLDIPEKIDRLDDSSFQLHNLSKDGVLGRYLEEKTGDSNNYTFQLLPQGGDYFFLKIKSANGYEYGIDHYYGEDIKKVDCSQLNHPNHIWRFVPSKNDPQWFRIQNKASGKVLDHYYGRSLAAANLDEHPNPLWQVLTSRDGNGVVLINQATGGALGLDRKSNLNAYNGLSITINVGVLNSDLAIPNEVDLWKNINWKFLNNSSSTFYNLINEVNTNAVDYYDGESFRFVSSPSSHPNHLWEIQPTTKNNDGSTYFFIKNNATGKVLDYYYGKKLSAASDTDLTAPNQFHLWKLV